ncbi:MAG TPA: SIS domain-containing protein [Pseudomonadales bacterium]|nr:SIS domain-containing protein [Pseudomonadales bacterium]
MILNRLQQSLNQLSKAERRIAEAILNSPADVVHMTTAELARAAEVSDPMVSRLCRTIGCRSFPDLKVQLASGMASGNSYISSTVSSGDNTETFANKIIGASMNALEYLRSGLDVEAIEQAIAILRKAKRIEIFGMGGCASIAADAQNRFFRSGIPTVCYEDTLKQRMAAASSNSDTAVLIITFTGRTKDMIETAEIVNRAGGNLIAITAIDSPIAKLADVAISSAAELEDTTIYVPMVTRIVILTIIDILTTGLALQMGPEIETRLQLIKHSLDLTKVAK